jgi:hypothetical protein
MGLSVDEYPKERLATERNPLDVRNGCVAVQWWMEQSMTETQLD